MIQWSVPDPCAGVFVQLRNLLSLIRAFLIRVAVLLEAADTVLHFWSAKPCQQRASLDDTDVHDSGVETLDEDIDE